MIQNIHITGMHCNSCVAKIKQALEANNAIQSATVDLDHHRAELELTSPMSNKELNEILGNAGNYNLDTTKKTPSPKQPEIPETTASFGQTYKPLFMIVGFILGVSVLVQYPFEPFDGMLLMRHFMAGFFIVFSFFKFLNLKGFASSYAMYDLVAGKWKSWGYIYPFVELLLGIAYLTNTAPTTVNWITIVVLGISSIGVIESNLNKRKIKCACLGDVFNLPMSTVTVVEDLSMVAMAALMLIL